MKGSPLLRACVAFVLIALAGIPLWKLTRASGTAAPPVRVESAGARVTLRLTFSPGPESFVVAHLGKVLWAEASHLTDESRDLALPFPKEGVDLVVKVTWPGEAEGALRLRLTDPDGHEHDKTIWGRGAMEEVVTFP